jgi:hypothetical protein
VLGGLLAITVKVSVKVGVNQCRSSRCLRTLLHCSVSDRLRRKTCVVYRLEYNNYMRYKRSAALLLLL